MSSSGYYRDEAARCRELAAKWRDANAIKRWFQMAHDYGQPAENVAATPQMARGAPQVQRYAAARNSTKAYKPGPAPEANKQQVPERLDARPRTCRNRQGAAAAVFS
jgi:hypothetical protein